MKERREGEKEERKRKEEKKRKKMGEKEGGRHARQTVPKHYDMEEELF